MSETKFDSLFILIDFAIFTLFYARKFKLMKVGCRNIYSRIVYSRTIYPNIFTLRLNYSLGILPHGILILKYFYSVEIQFSGIFHPWTIYPKILCSMDQLSYGEFYLKFFCTKDFMSFRSLTLRFFWTLDYLPQDFVY